MKTCVLVGAEFRGSSMYARPLAGELTGVGRLVGIYDVNAGRAADLALECIAYAFASFGIMIAETRPDVVIVTTVDHFHDEYAIQALEAGCDVIVEKPTRRGQVQDKYTCSWRRLCHWCCA